MRCAINVLKRMFINWSAKIQLRDKSQLLTSLDYAGSSMQEKTNGHNKVICQFLKTFFYRPLSNIEFSSLLDLTYIQYLLIHKGCYCRELSFLHVKPLKQKHFYLYLYLFILTRWKIDKQASQLHIESI